MNSEARWQGYVIRGVCPLDTLITNILAPLIESPLLEMFVDESYFLRYGASGLHLRLRICLREGIAVKDARAALMAVFQDVVRANEVSAVLDGGSAQTLEAPEVTIEDVIPELELHRYGGSRLYPLATAVFAESSRVAIAQLREHMADPSSQARSYGVLSWWLVAAAAASLSVEEANRLLEYGEMWFEDVLLLRQRSAAENLSAERKYKFLRTLFNQVRRRTGGELLGAIPRLLEYSMDLRELPEERRVYALQSVMHMHANRLGLSNSDEAFMSMYLSTSLSDAGDRYLVELGERLRARSAGGLHEHASAL